MSVPPYPLLDPKIRAPKESADQTNEFLMLVFSLRSRGKPVET